MVERNEVFRGKGLITGIHDQHLERRLAAAINAIQEDQQRCFSVTGRDNGADPYLTRIECHRETIYLPYRASFPKKRTFVLIGCLKMQKWATGPLAEGPVIKCLAQLGYFFQC